MGSAGVAGPACVSVAAKCAFASLYVLRAGHRDSDVGVGGCDRTKVCLLTVRLFSCDQCGIVLG